jgi:3',5'-cyclic AMP phosphodiesterase CpdA
MMMMKNVTIVLAVVGLLWTTPRIPSMGPAVITAQAQDVVLPLRDRSTRFLVLGDTGTGGPEQYEIGRLVETYRQKTKFDFALLLGDNIYGSERPQDFAKKFEIPYKAMLDAGVKFYASLGNHDDPNQRFYKPFNMGGERYYTFDKGNIRFFALDSNYMDRKQVEWLDKALRDTKSDWKIAYFHHPLYSSGAAHGSEDDLRLIVEPLFTQHGVNVVLAGHEHFYERVKPQKGIYYFTNGGAAKLRKGDIRKTGMTEKGYDTDYSFMIVEIDKDNLSFQTISRVGKTIDSGTIVRAAPPVLNEKIPPQPSPAPRQSKAGK